MSVNSSPATTSGMRYVHARPIRTDVCSEPKTERDPTPSGRIRGYTLVRNVTQNRGDVDP
jgi:hypothetical protein